MGTSIIKFVKNGIITVSWDDMKKIFPEIDLHSAYECQKVLEAYINKKIENLYILDDSVIAKLMPEGSVYS